MNQDSLTCVVPTHNRPQFLRRLLRFYTMFPPGFPFLIVDSSDPSNAAENVAVVNGVPDTLRVSYRHINLNVIDKCVQGLESLRSPFVVFCADDDFLFPNAVWRCVDVLKNEPECAAVMGRTSRLNVDHPNRRCVVLKGYSIEDRQALDRCRQMAANWMSTFYGVYRTETLLDNFQITAACTDSRVTYHMPEMMLSQLSVLRGGIKVLPVMYLFRERHDANAGRSQRTGIRPQAEPLYQRFKAGLVQQFVRTGIDQTEAERFIDDTYGYFREPSFTSWRRKRSAGEVIRRLLSGVKDRWVDFVRNGGTHHRRFVRARDLVGCEANWDAAVKLMRDHPHGIKTGSTQAKRCA